MAPDRDGTVDGVARRPRTAGGPRHRRPERLLRTGRRHQNRLWAVALRTTGSREDAADAVQDALLSAYRNASSYRGDAAVTTWLHRIVVNASLDLLRRKSARPAVPLPDDADRIPAQGDAMAARETVARDRAGTADPPAGAARGLGARRRPGLFHRRRRSDARLRARDGEEPLFPGPGQARPPARASTAAHGPAGCYSRPRRQPRGTRSTRREPSANGDDPNATPLMRWPAQDR